MFLVYFVTSLGEYKNDLSGASMKHIVIRNYTLKSYSTDVKVLPLYHGENTFELMYSMK